MEFNIPQTDTLRFIDDLTRKFREDYGNFFTRVNYCRASVKRNPKHVRDEVRISSKRWILSESWLATIIIMDFHEGPTNVYVKLANEEDEIYVRQLGNDMTYDFDCLKIEKRNKLSERVI